IGVDVDQLLHSAPRGGCRTPSPGLGDRGGTSAQGLTSAPLQARQAARCTHPLLEEAVVQNDRAADNLRALALQGDLADTGCLGLPGTTGSQDNVPGTVVGVRQEG